MPTPTSYSFTQQIDYPSILSINIQQSSISVALDHIDTSGSGPTMSVVVWFKDVLSSDDQTTLDSTLTSYVNTAPPATIPVVTVQGDSVVTTQYELNDKDLKLAKIKASVQAGTPNQAQFRIKIPGTFGNDSDGRYVAGGDGWLDTFDADDHIVVECYDDDKLISAAYGQGAGLGRSMTDEEMIAQGDFPSYPLIKSYTDLELSTDNQGWYFWPLALGNNLPPMGEVEFEPIAGYGHVPAGLYLVITAIRPNVATGTLRGNLFWGKKE